MSSHRPKKAVAVLSGGLDSAVALALARRDGWEIALALTYDYGQRAAAREAARAGALCQAFGIAHRALALPFFREWTGSALVNASAVLPRPNDAELDSLADARVSAKAVWVPNRNGIFLEVAAGFAENLGASAVIVGFNREEATTFPDNSEAYQRALTSALAYSTANRVEVLSPTAGFYKREIVRLAREIDFPFELLWSCYEGGERMCGRCESCRRLSRALRENGVDIYALFDHVAL